MENLNRPQLQELIPNAVITSELVHLQTQCAVCFVEFYLNENGVRKLQCNHLYHGECLFPWLQRNASCPVCRAPLSTNVQQNRASFMERLQIDLSTLSDNLTTLNESLSTLSTRLTNVFEPLRQILEQPNLVRRQSQAAVRLRNITTTITSAAGILSPNVSSHTNRTPLQTVVSSAHTIGYENPVRALGVSMNVNANRTTATSTAIPSLNVNAQINKTLPQTVVSSTRDGGYENQMRALRESTHATVGASLNQRRAALRATVAIANVYRRQQRAKNLKTID